LLRTLGFEISEPNDEEQRVGSAVRFCNHTSRSLLHPFRRRLTRDLLAPIAMLPDAVTIRFASHLKRALSALRNSVSSAIGLESVLFVHVAHERLERVSIALKP